jgi:hypothetical protein
MTTATGEDTLYHSINEVLSFSAVWVARPTVQLYLCVHTQSSTHSSPYRIY